MKCRYCPNQIDRYRAAKGLRRCATCAMRITNRVPLPEPVSPPAAPVTDWRELPIGERVAWVLANGGAFYRRMYH